jgi:hypothetical protein
MPRLSLSRSAVLALALLLQPFGALQPLRAATSERIVADPHSGIALHGYDPVSYFIDGGPRAGASEFEHRHAGLVWRFRSAANRAAFVAEPERYIPVFGGHDAAAAADGRPVPGSPLLYAIEDGRLYLFSHAQSRLRFMAQPAEVLALAQERWPALERTLAP